MKKTLGTSIVIVLIIAAIFARLQYSKDTPPISSPESLSHQPNQPNNPESDSQTQLTEEELAKPENPQSVVIESMDLATIRARSEALDAWADPRGYADEYRDYGRLPEPELRTLAEQGDILALHAISARYSMEDPQLAIDYLDKAALFGSTAAMIRAGQLYDFHTKRGKDLVPLDDPDSGRVTALAYHLSAQLSGDDLFAVAATAALLKGTEFDDTLLQRACEEGREITENNRKSRDSVGLPHPNMEPAPKPPGWQTQGADVTDICS